MVIPISFLAIDIIVIPINFRTFICYLFQVVGSRQQVSVKILWFLFGTTIDLNCACVGGGSRTPLGVVSFAENAIMAIMGGVLLFNTFTGEAETAKLKEVEPTAVVRLQNVSD